LQTLDTIPADSPESTVADIHFSPTGQHVYVSNRGHNSVAVFGFGEDSRLTRLGIPSSGGDWPRNFALAPDGQFMLVANRYSNQISVMPILAGGTEIGAAITQAQVEAPSCVKFVANILVGVSDS
jgi:6-phosphogluconolactonase